jgi:hypothetical protein
MSGRVRSYLRRHHVGLLALFVALGGTSYAAAALPRNSVGPKQLRAGAVRTSDIKAGAVTLAKIKPSARAALRGATGPRGLQGPRGPAGTFSGVTIRFVEFMVTNGMFSSQERADCAAGEVAVGGGVGFPGSPSSNDHVLYSAPSVTGSAQPTQGGTPTNWQGIIFNDLPAPQAARVYVVCAR